MIKVCIDVTDLLITLSSNCHFTDTALSTPPPVPQPPPGPPCAAGPVPPPPPPPPPGPPPPTGPTTGGMMNTDGARMTLKRVNWEKLSDVGLENTVWAQVVLFYIIHDNIILTYLI